MRESKIKELKDALYCRDHLLGDYNKDLMNVVINSLLHEIAEEHGLNSLAKGFMERKGQFMKELQSVRESK